MYICIVSEKLYQNTFKDIQTTFKIICGFVRLNWIFKKGPYITRLQFPS